VITTIPLGLFSSPSGVAVTPDGFQVYVSNQALGTVAVIDPVTNTVIGSIPVGSNPTQIAMMPVAPPATKDECRNGNFEKFLAPFGPFKNQGQCIKFINK
jgi:YVTN family beta-propeller protein